PGDTVLVERGRAPRNGDIVIACVDGEWTMKYFYKQGRDVRLEPANARYATIRPRQRLAVEGVVSGVVRKLG
ncbi:MAG: S24 family peptidase, partial [Kiritimatiellia bacterium]|nr:S24 family peptidase [Kiritimatiellia bacterium]